jgi:mannan endo-1,6-alpha-mannosidase
MLLLIYPFDNRSLTYPLENIKDVSRQLAESAMKYYHGNEPGGTPGLLPGDFNWWEAGALFGQMVEYWY